MYLRNVKNIQIYNSTLNSVIFRVLKGKPILERFYVSIQINATIIKSLIGQGLSDRFFTRRFKYNVDYS